MFLNKKNKTKTLSLLLSLLLLFSFSYTLFFINTVKANEGTVYTIWLSTDPQISSDRAQYNYTYWDDAVTDANSVGVNISFCIGDCIQGYSDDGGAFDGDWDEVIWEWSKFYTYFDNINTDIYKNITIGNHDIFPATGGYPWPNHLYGWRNHTYIDNITHPYGNYTWEWGNILFVMLALEDESSTPVAGTQWYTNQTSWFNSIVTDNADKNILVMCHVPLRDTTNPTNPIPMDVASSNAFKATIAANDNVRGFFNGHLHDDNQGAVFTYGNCTCIDCDSVNNYGTRSSVFLYIQEDNATVLAKGYNHATNSFVSIGNLPTTFDLKYNFTTSSGNGESNESTQFISINGGTNGTTIYNSTPTFNWTVVSDASQYWLQIDNNADFSSPEINITDINQWNYPLYYSENSTRISFTLPNSISKGYHYCRVKAYVKG